MLVPEDWANTQEAKNGDGTPTIDVCVNCKEIFYEEGHQFHLILANGHSRAVVGSMDVEHPPYEMEDYGCDLCGATLKRKDN